MSLTIREASIDDAPAIAEINKNDLGYIYSVEETASSLSTLLYNPDHKILVACLDSEIAGYIHACNNISLFMKPTKHVLALAVSQKYRRMNAGSMLLESIEAWAQQEHSQGIILHSNVTRVHAHKFYESCGYTSHKQQKYFQKYFK